MLQHHTQRVAAARLVLLLILGGLLTGGGLGHLVLPPGRLGPGADVGVPVAEVYAAAAAATCSSSSSPESGACRTTDGASFGGRLGAGAAWRIAVPTGSRKSTATVSGVVAEPSRHGTRDWRVELQVGLAWQYAAEAGSRALRAPDNAHIGQPR